MMTIIVAGNTPSRSQSILSCISLAAATELCMFSRIGEQRFHIIAGRGAAVAMDRHDGRHCGGNAQYHRYELRRSGRLLRS